MLTGRDLIVYILSNKLEDKPIFHNGKLMGFMTVDDVAVQLGVGTATVYAMCTMQKIDYICIGDTVLFPAIQPLNETLERKQDNEQ